ncbi:reticulon-like protein B9 isoform X2 [Mangifera indica]|uniref:reticulon-like protein B9 isoform X2 n=1 Tax=Mangifera indica TaxID=29780 RepID=UPI001CF9F063|nr:reticulon-like protein B9 isoform X2 [Mangifera indica]
MLSNSTPADFHSATAGQWLWSTSSAFKAIKDEVIFLREEVTESAALLIGMTIVWFFVEVMEYSFFSLLCHISMIVILVTYTRIWLITTFYWDPLRILKFAYSEARFREVVVHIFSSRIDIILFQFLRIAYGQNAALLILVFSA